MLADPVLTGAERPRLTRTTGIRTITAASTTHLAGESLRATETPPIPPRPALAARRILTRPRTGVRIRFFLGPVRAEAEALKLAQINRVKSLLIGIFGCGRFVHDGVRRAGPTGFAWWGECPRAP